MDARRDSPPEAVSAPSAAYWNARALALKVAAERCREAAATKFDERTARFLLALAARHDEQSSAAAHRARIGATEAARPLELATAGTASRP
jgi:hypothetical protein